MSGLRDLCAGITFTPDDDEAGRGYEGVTEGNKRERGSKWNLIFTSPATSRCESQISIRKCPVPFVRRPFLLSEVRAKHRTEPQSGGRPVGQRRMTLLLLLCGWGWFDISIAFGHSSPRRGGRIVVVFQTSCSPEA